MRESFWIEICPRMLSVWDQTSHKVTCDPQKSLQLVCILGAGLLCGTALAVVIPEGVSLLEESYRGEDSRPSADNWPTCPQLGTTRPSSSLGSILLLFPSCCHAIGAERQSLHRLHASSGRHRIGSNLRLHPHVCGGSDQHSFLHARPVGFYNLDDRKRICRFSD